MHALIKDLAIRWVENRSEIHPNDSQHLAEGTEVARLRRRFPFVFQQALSFYARHHLCRQRVALAGSRQLRSQGPVSVHKHCIKEVTGSEGREGANGPGGGIRVGGENEDRNGGGDGDVAGTRTGWRRTNERKMKTGTGAGTGAGTGTGTWVETRGRTQNGNGDGSWDGNESSSGDSNEGDDANGDGNEDGIGEGGGKAKNRRNRTRVVDAMWETGETWVER